MARFDRIEPFFFTFVATGRFLLATREVRESDSHLFVQDKISNFVELDGVVGGQPPNPRDFLRHGAGVQ